MYDSELVVSNLKMADNSARWWRRKDSKIEYDDYYQQACLGLIVAATNFNPIGPATFKTYAAKFIDGAIGKMRSAYYTGSIHGLHKKFPVPIWILIDHQEEREDEQKWVVESENMYFHNFALREEIKKLDLKQEMAKTKLNGQKALVNFIVHTRAAMKDKKIKMTELAKKIGITQGTLSRWLSNDIKLTKEKQGRITEALKDFV